MPLDRPSALRRALIQTNHAPRMKLPLNRCGRIGSIGTVEYVQRPASPKPFNIRSGKNPLIPTVPALTVPHVSQPLPGLGNRLHNGVHAHIYPCQLPALSGRHVRPQIRRKPQEVIRLAHGPGGYAHVAGCNLMPLDRRNIFQGNVIRVWHDRSSLENDSHVHQPTTPADLVPPSLPSPPSESTEIREALSKVLRGAVPGKRTEGK